MTTHRHPPAAAAAIGAIGAIALVAALGLAGCSDGSSNSSAPPTDSTAVPDSAAASPAAFVSYLGSLSGTDESSEPLTLKDSFAVPAEESADATPLT